MKSNEEKQITTFYLKKMIDFMINNFFSKRCFLIPACFRSFLVSFDFLKNVLTTDQLAKSKRNFVNYEKAISHSVFKMGFPLRKKEHAHCVFCYRLSTKHTKEKKKELLNFLCEWHLYRKKNFIYSASIILKWISHEATSYEQLLAVPYLDIRKESFSVGAIVLEGNKRQSY